MYWAKSSGLIKMFATNSRWCVVLLAIFVAALLFFSGCLEKTCFNSADCPLSDSEYIQTAKTTPETQAFLKKYPNAIVSVERTEYLAVDFTIEKSKGFVASENNPMPPYLRLRVFVNPSANKPLSSFIECSPSEGNYLRIDENLVQYIGTEKCLTQ